MKDTTMKQMCEHIVKAGVVIRNTRTGRTHATAEEIFNSSPTGELWHIFDFYEAASERIGEFADGTPYRQIVGIAPNGDYIRESPEST